MFMLRKLTLFTFLLLVCQFALADQAFDSALVDAKKGDADAQYNLGAYYAGNGVVQDYKQALKWYTAAAEQGHAMAQGDLAYMYDVGNGVVQDYRQALKWYTKAAEQGYAMAQNNLGIMYKEGQGVAQDYRQALYWYSKSAEQGYALAQYNLGYMFFNGHGIAPDQKRACELVSLSAVNGYQAAIKERASVCATKSSKARCLVELDACIINCDTQQLDINWNRFCYGECGREKHRCMGEN